MPQNTLDDKSTYVCVWFCAVRQQSIVWANVDPDLSNVEPGDLQGELWRFFREFFREKITATFEECTFRATTEFLHCYLPTEQNIALFYINPNTPKFA